MHIFNHIQFLNGLLGINLHIIVYNNNCHSWLNYKETLKFLIETYNYLIWIIVLTMSFKVEYKGSPRSGIFLIISLGF